MRSEGSLLPEILCGYNVARLVVLLTVKFSSGADLNRTWKRSRIVLTCSNIKGGAAITFLSS